MILLIKDSECVVRVLTGQHSDGFVLAPSVLERSAVVQGLISDFHGQQCSTTLPVCVEAFMAWMHGIRGSPEQDVDVLNVRCYSTAAVRVRLP
jgi:hypothetical protein